MRAPAVAIVGAGPAGVRAAETLARAGLRPTVIDEAPAAGGQIYRRPPPPLARPAKAIYGYEAAKAQRLHRNFDALRSRIDYFPETLVWNIAEGTLRTVGPRGARALSFDALILCTGAMDRVLPVPGWTRAGVYTLGGAQTALKAQGCAVGRRIAFFGTGPLLYLVAHQHIAAGIEVAGVFDTAPSAATVRALAALLARPAMAAKGLRYMAGPRLHGVPMARSVRPVGIAGDEWVRAFVFRDRAGRTREVACDAVAMGFGLLSETRLADLAGCRFVFDALSRQWIVEADGDGRAAGAPSVYVAGDGARLLGADAAELSGELAALAVLADLGRQDDGARRRALRRRLRRHARFAAGVATAFPPPPDLARGMDDGTVLCRCESVTAGAFREAVPLLGTVEINRAKAFTRLGMGRCQGRFCAAAAAEILAAESGRPVESVGRLRAQAPARPVPLGDLLAPAEARAP